MQKDARIFVAGHNGLVGSALVRRLHKDGHEVITRTREQLDLRDTIAVNKFFNDVKPQFVFLAAARVGGIKANNDFPVEFLRDNLAVELAVIDAAHNARVEKLIFLGSSCVYPKFAPQPMKEDDLLTGPLEPTNEPYAIAKIAGIKLCDAFRRQHGDHFFSVMPTNLYGPNDNFDLATSHVLPALIRRMHEAKIARHQSVTLWGTGTPRREFLHVDDLADACVYLMNLNDNEGLINIGVGEDLEIRELAAMIKDLVGFEGTIEWDASKPDGTPRKLLDVSRLSALGWTARIPLRAGITGVYEWFRQNSARDGRVQHSRVQDGRVQDGGVQDGGVQDGRVQDGRAENAV